MTTNNNSENSRQVFSRLLDQAYKKGKADSDRTNTDSYNKGYQQGFADGQKSVYFELEEVSKTYLQVVPPSARLAETPAENPKPETRQAKRTKGARKTYNSVEDLPPYLQLALEYLEKHADTGATAKSFTQDGGSSNGTLYRLVELGFANKNGPKFYPLPRPLVGEETTSPNTGV